MISSGEDGTIRLSDITMGGYLRVLTMDCSCEGIDISGVTGLTNVQKETFQILGAIERQLDRSDYTFRVMICSHNHPELSL
jgi:hypothetical protein